jgi:small subunit ribosomal protein S21
MIVWVRSDTTGVLAQPAAASWLPSPRRRVKDGIIAFCGRVCLAPSGATDSARRCLAKVGGVPMQVLVRDNNIDQALRVLKKKLQREGTFREMKRRRAYEKPFERRAREKQEAVRRMRKALRKRMESEGY